MKELIEFVVNALVDDPATIEVTEVVGDKVTIFELRADKADIGKIIGKRGKTIMAIRSLVSGAAGRLKKRVTVEVVD